jgi:hypothetical protein
MAIEIKELIIKMVVHTSPLKHQKVSAEFNDAAKKQIIKECVDKVLDKLESKIER